MRRCWRARAAAVRPADHFRWVRRAGAGPAAGSTASARRCRHRPTASSESPAGAAATACHYRLRQPSSDTPCYEGTSPMGSAAERLTRTRAGGLSVFSQAAPRPSRRLLRLRPRVITTFTRAVHRACTLALCTSSRRFVRGPALRPRRARAMRRPSTSGRSCARALERSSCWRLRRCSPAQQSGASWRCSHRPQLRWSSTRRARRSPLGRFTGRFPSVGFWLWGLDSRSSGWHCRECSLSCRRGSPATPRRDGVAMSSMPSREPRGRRSRAMRRGACRRS